MDIRLGTRNACLGSVDRKRRVCKHCHIINYGHLFMSRGFLPYRGSSLDYLHGCVVVSRYFPQEYAGADGMLAGGQLAEGHAPQVFRGHAGRSLPSVCAASPYSSALRSCF